MTTPPPTLPNVPLPGTVLELAKEDWRYGGQTLFLLVEFVRLDLSAYYDNQWVWITGQQLALDGTPMGHLDALVRVAALPSIDPATGAPPAARADNRSRPAVCLNPAALPAAGSPGRTAGRSVRSGRTAGRSYGPGRTAGRSYGPGLTAGRSPDDRSRDNESRMTAASSTAAVIMNRTAELSCSRNMPEVIEPSTRLPSSAP